MQFTPCESDYDFEKHVIPFLQISAFYAELSRHVKKVVTDDVPTMAISYDVKNDDLVMGVNPKFMKTLTNGETRGGIRHEFDHVVFGHLSGRRRTPHKLWNVSTDLAINSLIMTATQGGASNYRSLPACALIPGQWPLAMDGTPFSAEQKTAMPLAELIASFPPMMASEWYFDRLNEAKAQGKLDKKNKPGAGGSGQKGKGSKGDPLEDDDDGDGGFGSKKDGEEDEEDDGLDGFDDHSFWDEIPEEAREAIEGRIKSIIEKAVRRADSVADGWGDMPADVREAVRRSVSGRINWRAVLRQFIGTIVRGRRTTSIKRINRRYPYIHPGSKRGWTAKLLIAIDESGSVGNEMLTMFFAELASLTRKVDVTILPFDCFCRTEDAFEWKKGTMPKLQRVKTGGTDFNAPTRVFNDPKNAGRWDALLIMTDGMAPAPMPSRGKRGWVVGEGCKLAFPSTELQISLSKEAPMTGAWR